MALRVPVVISPSTRPLCERRNDGNAVMKSLGHGQKGEGRAPLPDRVLTLLPAVSNAQTKTLHIHISIRIADCGGVKLPHHEKTSVRLLPTRDKPKAAARSRGVRAPIGKDFAIICHMSADEHVIHP